MTRAFIAVCFVAAPAIAQSADTVKWFQTTEQALMDALAPGDKAVWDRVMDEGCVITSEEGDVQNKQQFLADLRGLPPGLTGGIVVKELTVQELPGFAVVRYLADEWEIIFGQKLATKYRATNTYRRDGQSWKLVALHLSVVTVDPPAQIETNPRWAGLAGTYQLVPDGWTFTVEHKDGKLYGGRDPKKLRPFIAMTPTAFVLSGSLGEWLFVVDAKGNGTKIIGLRKFGPLVWTRIKKG